MMRKKRNFLCGSDTGIIPVMPKTVGKKKPKYEGFSGIGDVTPIIP